MKTALITGVTGQDGAYLARLLLERGYAVHGTSRAPEPARTAGLSELGILDRLRLHTCSLEQPAEMQALLETVAPDEVYHFAGQSSVGLSFEQPTATIRGIVDGTLLLLEAVRRIRPQARLYHSSTSEMFGGAEARPSRADDVLNPRSPYGVGKAAAHWATRTYRESYGLYACSGILFNHESPLRPARFVTRKIVQAAVRIHRGSRERLRLGNLQIERDWGYAPEYVEAMWRMLQQPAPDDHVIATGEAHALQEFVALAFAELGLDWRAHVDTDPALRRPNELARSVGDPEPARRALGWEARTRFPALVPLLVRAELARAESR